MRRRSGRRSFLEALPPAFWAALPVSSRFARVVAQTAGGRRDRPVSRTPTRRGGFEFRSVGKAAPRERGAAVRARAPSDRARPGGRALPVPAPGADHRSVAAALFLLTSQGAGPAA